MRPPPRLSALLSRVVSCRVVSPSALVSALLCRVVSCRVVSSPTLLQCVTRDTYVAALTRYKESFIGLPLPPSLGDSHDANVDQARKDLGRETSILLNGTLFPLGSGSAFVRFLLALVDTVSLACVSDVL